jgi:hypothetical protein
MTPASGATNLNERLAMNTLADVLNHNIKCAAAACHELRRQYHEQRGIIIACRHAIISRHAALASDIETLEDPAEALPLAPYGELMPTDTLEVNSQNPPSRFGDSVDERRLARENADEQDASAS